MALRKSRSPRNPDWPYFIVDPYFNNLASTEYGMDLDEVEKWLSD